MVMTLITPIPIPKTLVGAPTRSLLAFSDPLQLIQLEVVGTVTCLRLHAVIPLLKHKLVGIDDVDLGVAVAEAQHDRRAATHSHLPIWMLGWSIAPDAAMMLAYLSLLAWYLNSACT